MKYLTRLPFRTRSPRLPQDPVSPSRGELDPRVAVVARPARAVAPETRLGVVAEMLRTGPYRAVAIVEDERLVGLAGESEVLYALLGATDPSVRAQVRELPVRAIMTRPAAWVTPAMRTSEVAALFEELGVDVLPVVDAYSTYLGMVARSDLVQDLVRPFRPPTVGGMATPLGVYLTTGAVSGGAGTSALLLLGFLMFLVHLLAQSVAEVGQYWLATLFAAEIDLLPHALREMLGSLLPIAVQFLFLVTLLRLSPVAGYHAAEHQVVHALERAEPLLVETVRRMPRVHPRCGTNLVAGVIILVGFGGAVYGLPSPWGEIGVALSFVLALTYWRVLGAWLQEHFTTRPATDAQIESGIRAARELLEQHGRAPYAPLRPAARLWRLGFLQILAGFAAGNGLLALLLHLLPALRALLEPVADAVLF